MNSKENINVVFVCLGNICRSPTAEGVFQDLVNRQGLSDSIRVDSAGTGGWHVGTSPDGRAQQAALDNGYDISQLRARQVTVEDFNHNDFILAMDRQNLADLESLKPSGFAGHLGLFLDFARSSSLKEVPDPYYGGTDGFKNVLQLIEQASHGLLEHIKDQHLSRLAKQP